MKIFQPTVSGSLISSGSVFFPSLVTSSTAVSNVVMFGTNGQLFITASTAIGLKPGGPNQSIQFNSGSEFSGSRNFTFDFNNNTAYLTGSMIVSGSYIIDVSSSVDALRVTQRGDGNAILVEDSANPDATPFVVAADGRVGIGVTAPLSTYKLHVRNGAVTNSTTWGGSVGVFENSGSNAYLSILSSDTYVAGVGFGTAAHRVSANVNWNSTTKAFNLATNTASAYLVFSTDAGTERMRITSGGLVGINNINPQYQLDVSGSSRITGDLIVTGIIDGGTF